VRVDSDLELSEYFLGRSALRCFYGVVLALSLSSKPAPLHTQRQSDGRSSSRKPSGPYLQTSTHRQYGQIGDPVICYLRPHREFGTSVFPRGSYFVGRFAHYQDPANFVGKGWMRLEFDRLILSPTTEVPIATRVVAVRRYRMDPEGKIIERGAAEMMNLRRYGKRPSRRWDWGIFFDEGAFRRETMIRGTRAGRLTRNVMDLSWAKARKF